MGSWDLGILGSLLRCHVAVLCHGGRRRKRCGVGFGFGGKLLSFGAKADETKQSKIHKEKPKSFTYLHTHLYIYIYFFVRYSDVIRFVYLFGIWLLFGVCGMWNIVLS